MILVDHSACARVRTSRDKRFVIRDTGYGVPALSKPAIPPDPCAFNFANFTHIEVKALFATPSVAGDPV